MKKAILIGLAILLVAVAAGGAFYGGMQYQISLEDQAQANFLAARGEGGGQFPGGGQMLPGRELPADGQVLQGRQGGGITGTVKSVDGQLLTLSTAETVTTVTLTDATTVNMTVTGDLTDLTEGVRVMVTGEIGSDGNVTATLIQIVSSDMMATGTAP